MLSVPTVLDFLLNVGHTCGQFSIHSPRVSRPGTFVKCGIVYTYSSLNVLHLGLFCLQIV